MKRQFLIVFGIVFFLGLLRFGALAIERRPQRASNTLRRELLALEPVTTHRELLPPVIEGSTSTLFDCEQTPGLDMAALLSATHAKAGGAPPGIAMGTTGCAAKFLAPHALALPTGPLSLTQCLEVLALTRDVTTGSGTRAFALAEELTLAALPRCASAYALAEPSEHAQALNFVQSTRRTVPSLAQAFREEDLDQQLRVFGAWMRPVDRDELPEAAQKLARAAPPIELGVFAHQKLTSLWLRMTKASHDAIEALSLPPTARDEKLATLAQSLQTPEATQVGLTFAWPTWARLYERRLDALQQLELAFRLLDGAQKSPLGERDAADFELNPDGHLTSRLTGVTLALKLPGESP